MYALDEGTLRADWLKTVAQDVADFQNDYGTRVVILSSGALAAGRQRLVQTGASRGEPSPQAAGAVGQIRIAQAWDVVLAASSLVAAQLLLTPHDFATEAAQRAVQAVWDAGAVPCINENIPLQSTFDNDDIALRVALAVSADLLVYVSDVDGLYTADPRIHSDAVLKSVVTDITDELQRAAGGASSAVGTGGMAAKLSAARSAQKAGCHVVLLSGRHERPLSLIRDGGPCTWVLARV